MKLTVAPCAAGCVATEGSVACAVSVYAGMAVSVEIGRLVDVSVPIGDDIAGTIVGCEMEVSVAMGCPPHADRTPIIKIKTATLVFIEFI